MGDKRVPIQATATMREIMTRYYMAAKMSEGTEQKLAWITSGGPVEILHAAGVIPLYPENHAVMCGTSRMADDLCSVAEDRGYSRDLCSYARTDLGSIYTGNSPIGGLPRPDFLVCCNNICDTVTKWYQVLQRHFDVPLIFIDTPYQYDGRTPAMTDYVLAQLEQAIDDVGAIVGKPIDREELYDVLALSNRAGKLWQEIQDLLAHRPAPMNSFDTFIHMAPIVTLRGTQGCIDYYEELLAEIQDRVKTGIAAVPGEQIRLGWDNLAIWYKVKWLAEKFAEHHAALVVSNYTAGFSYLAASAKHDDPLRSMAESYLAGYINHGLAYRENELAQMAQQFSLDGMVLHSNRSCRAYSLGQYDLARNLEAKHGIPTLILEADMCDTRCWSDEQANTRIEAFMESLGSTAQAPVGA